MSEPRSGRVTSADGTTIVFDRRGGGPALILVGGALNDRTAAAALAGLLEPSFTTFAFDRRGRGDSGDTPPYAVEREIEDIEALVGEAGGSAFLMGHSSGAALVIETAARIGWVDRIALYEPPYTVDDTRPPIPADYVTHLDELVAQGRRGDAVEYFMVMGVGLPPEAVEQMRSAPFWSSLEALAHTLPYDGRVMGLDDADHSLPVDHWKAITASALVMDGGESPAWARNAVRAVTHALPHAERRTLPGQTHEVDPAVLAPVLVGFFGG
jgi:pimeloyl-ACP methyl ester carboxylesterase